MQKQHATTAVLAGLAVLGTMNNGSGQSSDKPGKRRGKISGIPKDAVDLHGETHDGIKVNSPKGQFLKGDKRVKLFTSTGKFAGVHDEQGLIDIEAGARTARAMLKAKQQSAASQ